MTSTRFRDSVSCAHQARSALFTSRIKKTQWLLSSERRSGVLRLRATLTMVCLSAPSRRPLQLDSQRPTRGPNVQSSNLKMWCARTNQLFRRALIASSSQSIRCCAGFLNMQQMCITSTQSFQKARPHTRVSTARNRRRNSLSLESVWHVPKRLRAKLDLQWRLGFMWDISPHQMSITSHYPMGAL